MSNVKISVILPVYNVEKYLSKCLDSIINQTFEDIEIICVNDGSTDNSLNILNNYQKKDNRIKIFTQENKGLSGARNTGMKHVNGKYILFIDSDDWIELDTIEKIYNYSEKLNLDLCIFPFRHFYQNDSTYETTDSTNLNMFDSTFDNITFNYKDTLNFLFKIPPNTWCKLYKTSFLAEINEEFIEGKYYEDVDFFFKTFFKTEKIGILKEKPFYTYRIRDKSITTNGDIKSFDIFEILDYAQSSIKKLGLYNQIKQDFFLYLVVNLKYVYIRLDKKYRDEYLKMLQKKFYEFNLNQVDDSINAWHFDDRVFYQAIMQSNTGSEFELTYKKLYYEFLANHYEGLANHLQNECNRLNEELNKKNSLKNKIKRIIK